MTVPINAGTDCSRSGAAASGGGGSLPLASPPRRPFRSSHTATLTLKRYSNDSFTLTRTQPYTRTVKASSVQLLLLRAHLHVFVF